MPQNRRLNPPSGALDIGIGSGVIIGDGIMLTAGHVMYEFNERSLVAARNVRTLTGATLYWDPRNYLPDYEVIFRALSNPLPSVTNPNQTISSQYIESRLRRQDIVFVEFSGNVGATDAGLATYLSPSDIATSDFGLTSGTKFKRWGQTTGEQEVANGFLAVGSVGLSITDTGAITEPGDSGGANWVEFEGREFVVGNNVSSNLTSASQSSFITPDEFFEINRRMSQTQTGNVTSAEPTNLVVGSANGDNVEGTYRADILLGRGGQDTLIGEKDGATAWGNDQIFGGNENDILKGGRGSDLLHGGDHRSYGGADRLTIENDGDDTADYGSPDFDKGIEITLGGPVAVFSDTVQFLTVLAGHDDFSRALTVTDRHYREDVDYLISIETISGTSADDSFFLYFMGSAFLAGSDKNGGLYKIEFGADLGVGSGRDLVGDLIDASKSFDKLLIDLNKGVALYASSFEAATTFIVTTGADSAYGGYGDDDLIGTTGANRLGGEGGKDTVKAGEGDDYIVSSADNADDTLLDGEGGEDTVIYKYDDGTGVIKLKAPEGATQGAETDSSGFGLDITVGGADPFGQDTLNSVEKAAVEAGSGQDTLKVAIDGIGVDVGRIEYIDLGEAPQGAPDTLDFSDWTDQAGAEADLGSGNVTINGASILVYNAERALGGAGNDRFTVGSGSVSPAGITVTGGVSAKGYILVGGAGGDELRGGAGDDKLYGTDELNKALDDNASDTFFGGAGNDQFYIGAGDRITGDGGPALERTDQVYFNGVRLTGGKRQIDENGVSDAFKDPNSGLEYQFSEVNGDLIVGPAGGGGGPSARSFAPMARSSGGGVAIEQFRNGDAGIFLLDAEPDVDDAERNRDPLIIDLDGDGYVATSLTTSGVYFDLNSDGFAERTAWVRSGDALLTLDKNGDGTINDGSELFGSGYVETQGAGTVRRGSDGFADLRQYDLNADSLIDGGDAVFSELRLWVDADADGRSVESELKTLAELGIQSISLRFGRGPSRDVFDDGTFIDTSAIVTREDGTTTQVYDAYLAVDTYNSREVVDDVAVPTDFRELPFLIGRGTVSNLDIAMTRDPALEEMVRAFADLQLNDAGKILDRVEEIILRWTGADQVEADSRGNDINGKWLHALEQIVGNDFFQAQVNSNNPRNDAAAILTREWQEFLTQTAAQLLGQTELGETLTPGLSFKAGAFFIAEEGSTLQNQLQAISDNAPADLSGALSYWHLMLNLLSEYAGDLGVTDAQINAAASSFLVGANIPYSAQQIRNAIFGASGAGEVVGTGWPSTNADNLLIAGEGVTELRGLAGDDAYLVSRDVGNVSISDRSGHNTLHLMDLTQSEITLSYGTFEGQPELSLRSIDGDFEVRIRAEIVGGKFQTDIAGVRFGDGTLVGLQQLLSSGAISYGTGLLIIGGAGSGNDISGGAGDDFIIGNGTNDIYRFGATSGEDIVTDNNVGSGSLDRLIIDAPRNLVSFSVSADGVGNDVIITIDGSPSRLTIVGQRAALGQQIEQFEFSDGIVLSRSEVDVLLNTGTSGDDAIFGSQSADVINGLAGNDVLRGNRGLDTYHFDAGWGEDRIVDGDIGNKITFGAGVDLEDIVFERGGPNRSDLIAIHQSTGDRLVIAGGLQRTIVDSFSFADNRTVALSSIIAELSAISANSLLGSDFDDRLIGTNADERFYGQAGDDYLEGNGGLDSYYFSRGTDTIQAGDGIDTLIAPAGATIADIQIFQGFGLQFGFAGFEGVTRVYGAFEFVRFDDGTVLSIGSASNTVGTSGSDLLTNLTYQNEAFTPGAGDDVMIGGQVNDSYSFEAGFGRDVIFDISGNGDSIAFSSAEHAFVNARFKREEMDLVISFSSSSDVLRVQSFFWNYPYLPDQLFSGQDAGVVESVYFFGDAGSTSLSANNIVSLISSKTSGDDWVMTGVRDGGAGNDILVGGDRAETFVFGVGYGHDVIKDSSTYDGGTEYRDTLVFAGLSSSDVSISRKADDPFSIVFTIVATGETLTVDGTPDDGYAEKFYESLGYSWSNQPRVGVTVERFQFTDGILNRAAIENMALASSATDGDDEIWGLNSDGTIDGGRGDDVIRLVGGNETLILSADSGNDVVSVEVTGKYGFAILLDGLSMSDIVYIPLDEVNGIKGKHVRIETSSGSSITVLHGRDLDSYPYYIEGGYREPFTINGNAYRGQTGPAESTGTTGTSENDNLRGEREFGYDPDIDDFASVPVDDEFDPLEGEDRIFGNGGNDTVIFGRGYGTDEFYGQFEDVMPAGNGPGGVGIQQRLASTASSSEPQSGTVVVEMVDGIRRDEVAINWLVNRPGYIEISIIGTADRLILQATLLGSIQFADQTLINGGSTETRILVNPSNTAPPLSRVDETVVATGGDIEVAFESDAGRDMLEDQRFNAHLDGNDDLAGWGTNTVLLRGGQTLDDFEFIRDAENVSNLVIRNLATGAEFVVENQFGLGDPVAAPAWRPVDQNGDGTADWGTIDSDNNGVADFAILDSNGDGTPDWIDPDFNQDGQSDWEVTRSADLDSGANGSFEGYAEDNDLDGVFELYLAYNDGNYVWARDTNGDGVPEEYTTDFNLWTAIPLDVEGNPDWNAIDTDNDGIGDFAALDGNGDQRPDLIENYQGGTQAGDWTVQTQSYLYDADGNFVASRTGPDANGTSSYFINGNQSGGLFARDVNGDSVPDEYGVDTNDNGEPDAGQPLWPRVVAGQFVLETTTGNQTYSWADIAERLVTQVLDIRIPNIGFDVTSLLPSATAQADSLILRSGDLVDSLAGDDQIVSVEGGGTFLFSAGDGNDVLRAATQRVFGDDPVDNVGDTVSFEGIIDPGQLRFLRGGDGLNDLIVEIRATGERLRIEEQFGPITDSSSPFARDFDYAPIVTSFFFDGGVSLNWSDVLRRIEGEDLGGGNILESGDEGGVLDGGAGADSLNGGSGDDIYVFDRAYGEDGILDAGGTDRIQFGSGISPSEIFFSRTGENGDSLLIEVMGLDRLALTVSGQFAAVSNRIEVFEFDDGTIWTWEDAQRFILDNDATGGDDVITGFASDDIIAGRGGNDQLIGAGGDDQIFGGTGRDTAVFSGSVSQYEIVTVDGVTTVRDLEANRDGTDILTNVEDVVFLGDGEDVIPLVDINVAPDIGELSVAGSEDEVFIIDRSTLLALASDANDDDLTIESVTDGVGGHVWFDQQGQIRFRGNVDYNGDAYFEYVVSDGNGGRTTGRVDVTLSPVNDAPESVVSLSEVFVPEDRPVNIAIPEEAFGDVDGDTLVKSATLVNGDPLPSWLTYSNGRITGTPPANFNGVLEIAIMASDGGAMASSSFTLNILPRNDAPVSGSLIGQQNAEAGALFEFILPANAFFDQEGDAIAISAELADGSPLPSWLSFDGTRFFGDVPPSAIGDLSIILIASDGQALGQSQFALDITGANTAPVASNDTLVSITEDAVLEIIASDLLANDTDADGNSLTITGVSEVLGGTAEFLENGVIRFSATPNYNGPASFRYAISDGQGGVATAVASFNIVPQNDAPVGLDDTGFVTNEDTPLEISVAALLANDSDLDGDTLSITSIEQSIGGEAVIDGNVVRFTPTANFYGDASFAYIVSDGQGGSSVAVVTLSVLPVNDPPIVMSQITDLAVDEDNAVELLLPADAFVDVDGQTLTLAAQLSSGNPLPSWLQFDGTRLFGQPPANFNGVLAVTVTATDGLATAAQQILLTINAVNDAPILSAALPDVQLIEDAAVDILLPAGSFSDIDSDALTYSATLGDGAALPDWLTFDGTTGRLTGTPPANFTGALDIVVAASDGALSASDTFRLEITPQNDAPTLVSLLADVAFNEDGVIDFILPVGSFADLDGDALTLSATLANGAALPSWLSFDAATSRFTGTPPADFSGVVDVQVTASDGTLSVSDAFQLTVTPINDAPVVTSPLVDRVFTEDTVIDFTLPLGSFTDLDGPALSYAATLGGGSALPSWLSFDASTQRFTGTPPTDFNGILDVLVTASDGTLSVSDGFRLTVTAANDAPTLVVALTDRSSAEDTTIDFTIPANSFADVDGSALTLSATLAGGAALPSWLSFDATTRRFTGTPPANFNGIVDVQVTASDGALTVSDEFRLTVTPVNDAPVAVNDGLYVTTSNNPITIGRASLLANDSDVDGTPLNITSVGNATGGSVAINSAGDIIFTPTSGFSGNASFQYTLSDGTLSAQANVAVRVDSADPFATWRQGTEGSDILFGNLFGANRIYGRAGNDLITGGLSADQLAGGNGNDILTGLSGNDEFWGGSGNDILLGGGGTDTAYYYGLRSSYALITQGGILSLRVTDNQPNVDGDDGSDQLSSIERLSFNGGETVNVTSPIILDLDGNGVRTVSAADSNARYDLDGDGLADDTSWIGSTEGFLFLDRDGNGTVSNAGEFSFIDDVTDARSDLEGLRAFDSNRDGILSSLDVRFGEFRVWQDRDGDGAAESGEILTLATAGVRSLNLTGTAVNGTTEFGDVAVINRGSYTRTNGTTMSFLDAALTYFSSATNLPDIAVQELAFTRKSKKYSISFGGGAMTINPNRRRGEIDTRAGALDASSLLSFRNQTIGMLSPIILDLDGDGVEMRSIKKAKAAFDMNGDGIADDTGWVGRDDGFLVIDRNNDGRITHASELSFAAEDADARSDLEALAALDNNGDGVLNDQDVRFGELKVWRDANGNGVTDAGELKTLAEVGITEISLRAQNREGSAGIGDNILLGTSSFTRANGSTGTVGNAVLAYRPGTAAATRTPANGRNPGGLPYELPTNEAVTDDVIGSGQVSDVRSLDTLVSALRGSGRPVIGDLGWQLPDNVDIFDYYSQPTGLNSLPDSSVVTNSVSKAGGDGGTVSPVMDILAPGWENEFTNDKPNTAVGSLTPVMDALPKDWIDESNLVPSEPVAPANVDRRLALMRQDMAAFGAITGENSSPWRREGVNRVVEFHA